MRVIRTIVLILVAIGALAPPARPSDFNWHGRLAPGQSVEIKGVNGAIHAERSSSTEVTVEAIKSGRHNDPNSVTVQAVPHGDGVTICAVYPSSDWGRPNECQPGSGGRMSVNNNDVKVEFTVHVPAGVRFIGRTVNGEVEAASLGGDVQAHTVNGKIRISTAGSAEAKTVNGSITARVGQAAGMKPLEFHTVNGGIELELPTTVNANIHASTVNGHISTDFPLMIHGKFSGREITGAIGQGGPDLSLKTVNGSIELHRAGS
jgi:Putative adhesin